MTDLSLSQQFSAQYASETRLYEFVLHAPSDTSDIDLGDSGLLVEGFTGAESLHEISLHDVILLSTNAKISLGELLHHSASLLVSLSDGTRSSYSGLINQVALLGSEGGFARYRVRLVSWLWLLTQQRNSRVWQEQTLQAIIESILAQYQPYAEWVWSDEVELFMADTRARSYCVQYRETDYDFISRLLAEEGLSFRIEDTAQPDTAQRGAAEPAHATADRPPTSHYSSAMHRMVIFADTTQTTATPEDRTSQSPLGGRGIRFHGGRSREEQDSIQHLNTQRQLIPTSTSVISYDYKAKQAIAASVSTHQTIGGEQSPALENYDYTGHYSYASQAEAARYATLPQQAHESLNHRWTARSHHLHTQQRI